MTAPTHIFFSSLSYLTIAGWFSSLPVSLLHVGICAIGALIPDVDRPTSMIGRAFFFLSTPIEQTWGHRTIAHSLVGLLILAVILFPLFFFFPLYFFILLLGAGTHLVADMGNISGIELFFPAKIRAVLPGNRHWRITVGSKAEIIFCIFCAVLCIFLWTPAQTGFFQALRHALGDFDSAHQEYIETCGENELFLEGRLKNTTTMKTETIIRKIIGYTETTLILEGGKTVGRSDAHYYPIHTKISPGKKIQTYIQRIDVSDMSTQEVVQCITPKIEHYIHGRVVLHHQNLFFPAYNPFSWGENGLTIRYATRKDLYRLDGVFQGGFIDVIYITLAGSRSPVVAHLKKAERKSATIHPEKYMPYFRIP